MFINFREKYPKSTHTTERVDNPPLRYASVISHACIAFVLVASLKRYVVNAVLAGGLGAPLSCSAQVKTGMKGMRGKWMRCMCLIEAFTRCGAFPVPQFTLVLSSQVRKKSACSCLCCRSTKVGLLKTLRLVLRCAVRHSLSSFCRIQDKGSMHDTQCISRLGWFIIRRMFV